MTLQFLIVLIIGQSLQQKLHFNSNCSSLLSLELSFCLYLRLEILTLQQKDETSPSLHIFLHFCLDNHFLLMFDVKKVTLLYF